MEPDIFDVHRALIEVCGREPKVSSQINGSLLVEVSSPEESVRLRAISSVPGTQVACAPHATLTQCKGVIFSRDGMRYLNEKLLHKLSDQDIVGVDRLQKKVDGVLVPILTFFLTFDRLKLPEVVKLAWFRLTVKPYISSPKRCFHCQTFGHVSRSCRRLQGGLSAECPSCGTTDHDGTTCPGPILFPLPRTSPSFLKRLRSLQI